MEAQKIVLATSIAETSLTIEGIKIVIDTGYGRTSRFDTKSGLSRLETIVISKDAADQRAGRAGRLTPGVCYRMWSLTTQNRMQAHRIPEIEASDLAPLILGLAAWGITDAHQLTWLTPPPKGSLAQARTITSVRGAGEGSYYPTGKGHSSIALSSSYCLYAVICRSQQYLSLGGRYCGTFRRKRSLDPRSWHRSKSQD